MIFDKVVLNVGDAYDPESGTFTAPKSGYYAFFFSGQKHKNSSWIEIYVKKNGASEFQILDPPKYDEKRNINSHFVLQLNENDEVNLEIHNGDISNGEKRVTFTGHLISAIDK